MYAQSLDVGSGTLYNHIEPGVEEDTLGHSFLHKSKHQALVTNLIRAKYVAKICETIEKCVIGLQEEGEGGELQETGEVVSVINTS